MSRDHALRVAWRAGLEADDIPTIVYAINRCRGFRRAGFKGLLIGTLEDSYDYDRKTRLIRVVRALDEEEILWLSEDYEGVRQKTNRRGNRSR